MFGDSHFYCWLKNPDDALYQYYPFVVVAQIFIISVVVKVGRDVARRAKLLVFGVNILYLSHMALTINM